MVAPLKPLNLPKKAAAWDDFFITKSVMSRLMPSNKDINMLYPHILSVVRVVNKQAVNVVPSQAEMLGEYTNPATSKTDSQTKSNLPKAIDNARIQSFGGDDCISARSLIEIMRSTEALQWLTCQMIRHEQALQACMNFTKLLAALSRQDVIELIVA